MGKIENEMMNTTLFLTTTTTVDQIIADGNAKSATVAALASTLTASVGEQEEKKNFFLANSYIESLSDTELAEMEQLLQDREDLWIIESKEDTDQSQIKHC